MLAEEQQALYQMQEEEDKEEEKQQLALERQRKLEQMMLQNDLQMNRAAYEKKTDAEKKDLIDQFSEGLKAKMANMKKMFKGGEPSDSRKQLQEYLDEYKDKIAPKTFKQLIEDEEGQMEEYVFTLPEKELDGGERSSLEQTEEKGKSKQI